MAPEVKVHAARAVASGSGATGEEHAPASPPPVPDALLELLDVLLELLDPPPELLDPPPPELLDPPPPELLDPPLELPDDTTGAELPHASVEATAERATRADTRDVVFMNLLKVEAPAAAARCAT
jgi:hypothetical protein